MDPLEEALNALEDALDTLETFRKRGVEFDYDDRATVERIKTVLKANNDIWPWSDCDA